MLVIAAGLSAKSVDIVFLGSGPYQFTPLPFKYVRPAAAADEATAVEAEASSGTSNGTLIGEPDCGGCWPVGLLIESALFTVPEAAQHCCSCGLPSAAVSLVPDDTTPAQCPSSTGPRLLNSPPPAVPSLPCPPGIILGAVCGVVLLVAIASAFAIRRHRMKKQDGQALVRKWEAERRCGECCLMQRREGLAEVGLGGSACPSARLPPQSQLPGHAGAVLYTPTATPSTTQLPTPPSSLIAAEESRRAAMEERRAASQRALDKVLSKDGKSASSRPPRSTSSVTASSSSQPSASNSLDRMRAVLGLRRDHLAAAAARMDAAEAAAAASSARRVPSIAGSDVATPLQAADFNASSGRPSPAPSVVSEATQGSSQGSEAPLTSVVVRQTGAASSSAAPAPSWATRDPGQAPKKGGFWTFGRS